MNLKAQHETVVITGVIVDQNWMPLPYTHVIALGSQHGDVTDKYGVYEIAVLPRDSLLILNIAFHDTIISSNGDAKIPVLKLKPKAYHLDEAKVFEWGSSYEDMLAEVERLGPPKKIGESMGLPQQDPDVVPFYLDEKAIKNKKMLLVAPVSYFYYNMSKREKNIRKAFQLEQDEDKITQYNSLLSPENLSHISGFTGDSLQSFLLFLNKNISCDYHCTELQVIQEIHKLIEIYQEDKN